MVIRQLVYGAETLGRSTDRRCYMIMNRVTVRQCHRHLCSRLARQALSYPGWTFSTGKHAEFGNPGLAAARTAVNGDAGNLAETGAHTTVARHSPN